jgi:hypothetical protein
MDGKQRDSSTSLSGLGFDIRCHRCGDSMPLLHPHIVVERYDEQENMICEECYEKALKAGS